MLTWSCHVLQACTDVYPCAPTHREDLQEVIPRLLGIGFGYKVVSSGQQLDNKSVAPSRHKQVLACPQIGRVSGCFVARPCWPYQMT